MPQCQRKVKGQKIQKANMGEIIHTSRAKIEKEEGPPEEPGSIDELEYLSVTIVYQAWLQDKRECWRP